MRSETLSCSEAESLFFFFFFSFDDGRVPVNEEEQNESVEDPWKAPFRTTVTCRVEHIHPTRRGEDSSIPTNPSFAQSLNL